MRSYVQVLGGGTPDGGSSLLVFFDERRYLFNCGEGTQRFCGQHHVRLSKLAAIFLSRLGWERTGGLPGMICTLADAGGTDRLQIVGPRNTSHFIGSLRAFLRRSNFELAISEARQPHDQEEEQEGKEEVRHEQQYQQQHEQEHQAGKLKNENLSKELDEIEYIIYQDDCIKVYSMEIFDFPPIWEKESTCKRRKTPPLVLDVENLQMHKKVTLAQDYVIKMFKDPNHYFDDGDVNGGGDKVVEGCDHDNGQNQHLRDYNRMPSVERIDSSLCFIIEGPKVPGRFDAIKAKALGVPAGPLNGRLLGGESVTLTDGTIVKPEQCVGEASPGAALAILEVATLAQANDLIRKFDCLLRRPRLTIVFHTCTHDIYNSDTYQMNIVKRISKTIQQVWINPRNYNLIYPSGAAICQSLSKNVDQSIFNVPFGVDSIIVNYDENPHQAQPLVKYFWHPPPPLLKPIPIDRLEFDIHKNNVGKVLNSIDNPPLATYTPNPDNPIVTFLGTGAALPGKYRNVSSTLVDFGDGGAYLLDCGEGTFGQIFRRFGPSGTIDILSRLKVVLISHLHADHQLGLPGLLKMVGAAAVPPTGPLNIVAPGRYRIFLEELAECADLQEQSYCFFDSESICANPEYTKEIVQPKIGLTELRVVPVIHCPRSYGFVLKHKSGKTFAFSGDTRPSKSLEQAGLELGTDVLIHEATFCDALISEAIDKRHSTLSEAIEVGQGMKARFTLLTHISQRYSKTIPPYNWKETFGVLPVLDMMSISFRTLETTDLTGLIDSMIANLPKDVTIAPTEVEE